MRVDLPFIALAVAVIWLPVVERKAVPLIRRKPLALFIDNARPVIFAMALVALAVGAVAMGFIAIGFLAIGKLKIGNVEIDRLTVRRLHVKENDTNV